MPHKDSNPRNRVFDEYDDEGKASQRSVNLRWATSRELEQCSRCENWLGHMRTKGGSLTTGACALVEGQVKTHEICDLYEKGPTFYDHVYGSTHPGAQGQEWCEECQNWFSPGHSQQHAQYQHWLASKEARKDRETEGLKDSAERLIIKRQKGQI